VPQCELASPFTIENARAAGLTKGSIAMRSSEGGEVSMRASVKSTRRSSHWHQPLRCGRRQRDPVLL
jgi:hypothetical protein